jgi:hypothetical protein
MPPPFPNRGTGRHWGARCRKVRRSAGLPTPASRKRQPAGRVASRGGTPPAAAPHKPASPGGSRLRGDARARQSAARGLRRRGPGRGSRPETAGSAQSCAFPAVDRSGSSDRLDMSKSPEKSGGSRFSSPDREAGSPRRSRREGTRGRSAASKRARRRDRYAQRRHGVGSSSARGPLGSPRQGRSAGPEPTTGRWIGRRHSLCRVDR